MKDIIKTAIGVALGKKLADDPEFAKKYIKDAIIATIAAVIFIVLVFVIYYATH